MISYFLVRTRRKVRSFWGSMSLTVLLAITVSWRNSTAYLSVVELSKVVLTGIPEEITLESGETTRDCPWLTVRIVSLCASYRLHWQRQSQSHLFGFRSSSVFPQRSTAERRQQNRTFTFEMTTLTNEIVINRNFKDRWFPSSLVKGMVKLPHGIVYIMMLQRMFSVIQSLYKHWKVVQNP